MGSRDEESLWKGEFGDRVAPQKNIMRTWRWPPTSQGEGPEKLLFSLPSEGMHQAEQLLSDPTELNGSLDTSSPHCVPLSSIFACHNKVLCIKCWVEVTLMQPTFYHLSLSNLCHNLLPLLVYMFLSTTRLWGPNTYLPIWNSYDLESPQSYVK